MYKRAVYQTIKARIEEPRRFIQVLTGARQTGKTTVVRQVLEDTEMAFEFFSADNVPASDSTWISDCWASVRRIKKSRGLESMLLVIDEIQKIPSWSEAVKKEWDRDSFDGTDIRLLLLGSSRERICRKRN